MPATPFRPFYDDYGCNRDRQIGQVGGFARVRREHELETQRIMNEHHQQQSLPDVVALDVPDVSNFHLPRNYSLLWVLSWMLDQNKVFHNKM